jgi:hypothetical protein
VPILAANACILAWEIKLSPNMPQVILAFYLYLNEVYGIRHLLVAYRKLVAVAPTYMGFMAVADKLRGSISDTDSVEQIMKM